MGTLLCVLAGYETSSTSNTTCVKPGFRPYRDWADDYSRLKLRDTSGIAVEHVVGQGGTLQPVLLTEHTYEIPVSAKAPPDTFI